MTGLSVSSLLTGARAEQVAKNISKWNNKQNELAKPKPVNPNGPPVGLSAANAALGVRSAPPQAVTLLDSYVLSNRLTLLAVIQSASTSKSPAPDDFEYTDISTLAATGKVACLLCQRQFKTEEVLRKHVAQSDLHKARRSPGLTLGPSWVQGHVKQKLTSAIYHIISLYAIPSSPNHMHAAGPMTRG
jgi:hypothetical protein